MSSQIPATSESTPKEKVEGHSANGSPDQKQDPIERRRLQNRLSQRNHRRKIRDRIAKLQERVIASELRVAASVNGWDQSRPLSSHGPYGLERPPPSPGLEPAQTSHCPSSTGICSACNSALCQMSLLSPSASSPSFFDAGTEFDPSTPSCLIDLSTSCPVTPGEAPLSLSPYTGANFAQSNLCDPVNYQPQSQPSNLYYVATESSLPYIIQALNTSPCRPRAIVLIPQDPNPNSQSSFSAPGLGPGPGHGLLSNHAEGIGPMNHNACMCHVQGTVPGSSAWAPGPGEFGQICPLHKPQWLSNYQVMML